MRPPVNLLTGGTGPKPCPRYLESKDVQPLPLSARLLISLTEMPSLAILYAFACFGKKAESIGAIVLKPLTTAVSLSNIISPLD